MPGSIELEHVYFYSGRFPLLRGVNLVVESNSIALISGRNGSAKSTLLELCAGLKQPARGRILWDGIDIATLTRKELLSARQRIGYMFQHYALISNFTIFDNIALPLRVTGTLTENTVSRRVHSIMEEVALFGVDNAFPESLSAGQLKSAALARALVNDPDILLLDEPLSGIAIQTQQGIRSVLRDEQRKRKRTVIVITHENMEWEGEDLYRYVIDAGKVHPALREVVSNVNNGSSHESAA